MVPQPSKPRPRIALTLGDPAGIGPELGARLLADPANRKKADIFVLADKSEVEQAAQVAGVKVEFADKAGPRGVQVLDDGSAPGTRIPASQVSRMAGERALHQLRRGVALAKAGKVDAIVFEPLNKTSMHLAGMNEKDELRWFAKYLGHDGITSEVNIVNGLWTARVTSHIPMKDVAQRVTASRVAQVLDLLNTLLSDYGIDQPRLGVCALNAHAGENGLFGREEIEQIAPGVKLAQENGLDVQGPFPSDTVFIANSRKRFDGILTMYHDQGQIAVKLLGFDGGVTLQGGLPIVVTTPAHGTGFDIVGKNVATITSSQNALDIAIAVAGQRATKQAAERTKVSDISGTPKL